MLPLVLTLWCWLVEMKVGDLVAAKYDGILGVVVKKEGNQIWVAWCDSPNDAPTWMPKQHLEVASEGR